MNNIKSQIVIVEFPLVFLLLSLVFLNISLNSKFENPSLDIMMGSMLNSIVQNNQYKKIILNEDLSVSNLSKDWTNLSLLLNNSFNSYGLIIINSSYSKQIFFCNSTYDNYYVSKFVSIYNNSKFDFREVILEVCN